MRKKLFSLCFKSAITSHERNPREVDSSLKISAQCQQLGKTILLGIVRRRMRTKQKMALFLCVNP